MPARGSHRSGRARLTHPAPRTMDSLGEMITNPQTQSRYPPSLRVDGAGAQSLRHRSLERFHDTTSPCLHRVSRGMGFPGFDGTMRCSESRPPVPPHFVSFVWRYHRCTPASLPSVRRAAPWAGGFCSTLRLPPSGSWGGDDRASQVPGGPPYARALLSDPDGTSAPGHYNASVQPSAFGTASAPAVRFLRGSITRPMHSLSTLRRVDYSTTTQDSLPAVGQTLPGGTGYPQGPNERFPHVSPHDILLSQAFPGANETKPSTPYNLGVQTNIYP